jgi:hypothetical protein
MQQEPTLTSGVFEPASSHQRFNKNSSHLRSVYASIFKEKKIRAGDSMNQTRYSDYPPVVVTTGAERISIDGSAPENSITRNVPYNIQ